MPVGPYHYFEPSDDPEAQAKRFCEIVDKLQKVI